MGQKNSKDELVYQQVIEGNVEAIKSLSAQGLGLEWIDKKGKTPLIVACMDPRMYIIAKTLIELGANLNAFRPGRHAGTPLHHAAKRGLDHTVKLLLSHGANPYVRNDDCQTPLDVARAKAYCNVVRAIEAHISYFSGEVREIPVAFLETFLPQRLSRKRSKKIWVVIVPCSAPNPTKPPKLELAVYNSSQDFQPRTVIALSKCQITEPKLQEPDPVLAIVDQSTGTRYKFVSAIEGDRRQLLPLYNACKGLPESRAGVSTSSNPADTEAVELAMALNASIQSAEISRPELASVPNFQPNPAVDNTNGWGDVATSAIHNEWGPTDPPPSKASSSGWANQPDREEYNGRASTVTTSPSPGPSQPQHIGSIEINVPADIVMSSAPSAPPAPSDILDDGNVHYPAIDLSPVALPVSMPHSEAGLNSNAIGKTEESCCVICWEAPVEGACVPCGHMAGCMSCLTEIKSKKGDCPVCRAKIDQIIRVYAV